MELHQVRYFVTLGRTLNFTRAANECNVTQPALTRAIQKLEEELGGPLLYRERTQTQLTKLGQAMMPHLRTMLDAAETARQLADVAARAPGDAAAPGWGRRSRRRVWPIRSARLARAFPDLAVHFEEDDASTLVEAMLAGTLDCALLPDGPDLPERVHRWKLCEEGCAVVLPAGHALAAREQLAAQDLGGETLLLGERCGGFALRLIAGSETPVRGAALRRILGADARSGDGGAGGGAAAGRAGGGVGAGGAQAGDAGAAAGGGAGGGGGAAIGGRGGAVREDVPGAGVCVRGAGGSSAGWTIDRGGGGPVPMRWKWSASDTSSYSAMATIRPCAFRESANCPARTRSCARRGIG